MRGGRLHGLLTGAIAALCFASPAAAQTCPGADAFEPNDDCASATVLGLGMISATIHGALAPAGANDDYFAITVPDNEQLTVDVLFTNYASGSRLRLYETAACALPPYDFAQANGQVPQTITVRYQNTTGAPLTVYVELSGPNFGSCVDYDLVATSGPIPACHFGPDDSFSPNHSCSAAALLTPGTYTDLVVYSGGPHAWAPDYFQIAVPPAHTLHVDARFIHDDGWIGATTYRSTDEEICDTSWDFSELGIHDAGGLTLSDLNEWHDTRHMALVLKLDSSSSNQRCNVYDLTISIEPPPDPTPTCFGDGSSVPCPCSNESAVGAGEGCESSVGMGAVLGFTGTTSAGLDDLTLIASQARPHQPGMLFQGIPTAPFPFKDGILCAAPPSERLEVIFTDANGMASSTTSIVTDGHVSLGQSYVYQYWYRDPALSPCGSGSNFSSGLLVDWH